MSAEKEENPGEDLSDTKRTIEPEPVVRHQKPKNAHPAKEPVKTV
jgi:hypothetical protein